MLHGRAATHLLLMCMFRARVGEPDLASSIDSAIWCSSKSQQADTLLLSLNDVQQLQSSQIPNADIAPSGAVQAAAAYGHPLDWLLVAPQCSHTLALSHIPYLQHVSSAASQQADMYVCYPQ